MAWWDGPIVGFDEGFAWWLVGLVDGEGHFGLTRTFKSNGAGPYYRCVFRVSMVGDEALLRMAHERTGWGSIHQYGRVTVWTCSSKQVGEVVEFFERYPLRSKKATEFGVWAAAARAQVGRRYLGRGNLNARAQDVLAGAYLTLLAMRGHEPKREVA